MVVCLFYLRGQCKYGDACKNEHVALPDGSQSGPDTERPTSPTRSKVPQPLPYTMENITRDLGSKKERPSWPLSSYGPFDDITLIDGLDVSPEEMRLRAVTTWRYGNPKEYILYETQKISAAEEVYNFARNNVSQLYERAMKQSKLSKTASTPTPDFGILFPSSGRIFDIPSTTFGNTTMPPSGSAFVGNVVPSPFVANSSLPSAFTTSGGNISPSFAVTSLHPNTLGNSSTANTSFPPGNMASSPFIVTASSPPSTIGNPSTTSSSTTITPSTSHSTNTTPNFANDDDVTLSDRVKLKRLEEELSVYKRAYAHLEAELGRSEKSKQEVERQKELLENQLKGHRVVALLDGDGAIFHPNLIAQGQAGGHTAARKLSDSIINFLSSSSGKQTTYYQLWVYVFLSKRGLSEALRKAGVVVETGTAAGTTSGSGKGRLMVAATNVLEDFMVGFNQAAERFVTIDVGGAKEAADAKIKAFLESEIRLPQTEKIIFGGCHDNGYVTTLRSQITAGFKHKLILLPSYTEMAAGINELALPSFIIPDLFLAKKLTIGTGHGNANLDGQGLLPPNLNPSTTIVRSPAMASKDIGPGDDIGNQVAFQTQNLDHGQKAGYHTVSLIDRIEMLSLKEYSPSSDVDISSPFYTSPRQESSELDCSESTVAVSSDYEHHDGEDDECVLMPRLSEPKGREGWRKVNPDIPLFKHKPPPCISFYLSSCKRTNCKNGHDYILEPEHYHELYLHAKKTPCPSKNKGETCNWGNDCYYGHYCPFLSRCRFYKQGNCKFVGPDMHG